MIKKLTPFFLVVITTIGCAKKESFDEVHKTIETSTKSSFFTPFSKKRGAENLSGDSAIGIKEGMSKKYLYVPMTLGTPREVAEANPFYQGDTKLVRLQFSKEGLEVLEVEKDSRFADNDLNNTPVLTIPGDHLAYRCKEDENGDCSNSEEKNDELPWDQKGFFKPNYADLEVKEVNFLDLVNIEGSDCVQPNGVRVVNYEVKKDDVINIELEKTYKLNKAWRCIRDNYFNDKFSYNSFKVRFFYSLVALDSLATKGYESLSYPLQNHDVYGYFKEESKKLNQDLDSQRKEITYLANRWDPNKKVLNYYLSASYSKPQNKEILDATMKSMKVMNKNLAQAGVNFKLNFIKQNKGNEKSPGDLRYNSIVLIDDPLANGLLGYAPSVKNPETGEIVQSHINMYGGVLTSGTRWVYDGAVDLMIEQNKKKFSDITSEISVLSSISMGTQFPKSLSSGQVANSTVSQTVGRENTIIKSEKTIRVLNENPKGLSKRSEKQLRAKLAQQMKEKVDFKVEFDQLMSGDIKAEDELEKRSKIKQAKELGYSLDSKRTPEFFPIAGTTKVVYPGLLKIKGIIDSKTGILKRWSRLSVSQKEQVKSNSC